MNIIYKDILGRLLKADFKNQITSYIWGIIIVIFFIINHITLGNLIEYSISSKLNFNIWDYILYILNNSSYYIYIYVPLTICTISFSFNHRDIYLIRCKSNITWLINKLISTYINCLVFVVLMFSIIIITSFKIPYDTTWSEFTYYSQYIFNQDKLSILTPIVAVLGSLVQLVLSLSIFSMVTIVGYVYIEHIVFKLFPTLVLWLLFIICLKSDKIIFENIKYIYLDNLFIFSKSINVNELGFYISIGYILLINILGYILCKVRVQCKDIYIGKSV